MVDKTFVTTSRYAVAYLMLQLQYLGPNPSGSLPAIDASNNCIKLEVEALFDATHSQNKIADLVWQSIVDGCHS